MDDLHFTLFFSFANTLHINIKALITEGFPIFILRSRVWVDLRRSQMFLHMPDPSIFLRRRERRVAWNIRYHHTTWCFCCLAQVVPVWYLHPHTSRWILHEYGWLYRGNNFSPQKDHFWGIAHESWRMPVYGGWICGSIRLAEFLVLS